MKHNVLFGCFLVALASLCLQADDYRWVKGTFSWKGNGTLVTQVIPLYGETYRVSYASPKKGALRITVVDAATRKPLPPKEIVDTQKLLQPSGKSTSGPQYARLVIEGDGNPWEVRVDQCLSSVQEWKLIGFQKEQKKPAERLGVWAGTGCEEIVFDAQPAPWKFRIMQDGEGVVSVTITSSDKKVCYKTQLHGAGQSGEGWITATDQVVIAVSATDTDWTIEAVK